jgi:hypothetical protein
MLWRRPPTLVCAWCDLARVGDAWVRHVPKRRERLTHGMCPDCLAIELREAERVELRRARRRRRAA